MATTPLKAAKKSKPRAPTLKQLVVRTQAIQKDVNDLLVLLRRLDRGDRMFTTDLESGLTKNIKPG